MIIKKAFLDTETSGLNPKLSAILEIGCILEVNGKIVEEFVIECSPFKDDIIDDKALEVNKIKKEDLYNRMPPRKAHQEFIQKLGCHINRFAKTDKFFFIGYNSTFDYQFLRAFFTKNDDKFFGSYFFYPSIDVAVLAAMHLMNDRYKMTNFKQTTVCTEMGIEVDMEAAHSALYDANLVKSLYNKLGR